MVDLLRGQPYRADHRGCARVPVRKLADVKLKSVTKRFFKEPRFAAGTRRDEIAECAKPDALDMPVEEFISVCLCAMQKIAPDLGL
jgi:predicted hydrolase (HD superfamily)